MDKSIKYSNVKVYDLIWGFIGIPGAIIFQLAKRYRMQNQETTEADEYNG